MSLLNTGCTSTCRLLTLWDAAISRTSSQVHVIRFLSKRLLEATLQELQNMYQFTSEIATFYASITVISIWSYSNASFSDHRRLHICNVVDKLSACKFNVLTGARFRNSRCSSATLWKLLALMANQEVTALLYFGVTCFSVCSSWRGDLKNVTKNYSLSESTLALPLVSVTLILFSSFRNLHYRFAMTLVAEKALSVISNSFPFYHNTKYNSEYNTDLEGD